MYISFMSVHTRVLAWAGRCPGGPELSWVLQGRQPRAPAQAGLRVQRLNHSSSITSLGHPSKPPLHSCPVLNLQCCPAHSSWSLTSVGFSCACSCSNKSEGAAPALEIPQDGEHCPLARLVQQKPLSHLHTLGNSEHMDNPP